MRPLNPLVLLVVVGVAACGGDAPTSAPRDRASLHEEEQPGPGASGPDLHSKNVKLLANVAKSNDVNQSDIAFAGRYAYAGNYAGFRIIDIDDPEHPVVVSTVACSGAQGDVSVYGDLLFQSVDRPQSSSACNSVDTDPATPGMFEGIRIFDVSNRAAPALIGAVRTDCGSHTHTLVPDLANGRVLLYVSSYPASFLSVTCHPPFGYISVVHVPLSNPTAATVSKYYLDPATQPTADGYVACHDIAVFLEIRRAAASCLSENQLWDISDPARPKPEPLWRFDHPIVDNAAGDIWHSATFSWDGTVVAFGDESLSDVASCSDPADSQGRVWFVGVATGNVLGSYKIPRATTTFCTVHYFNFVPLPKGRKVLVSAWYTGGTSVVDVDKLLGGASAAAAEIGFYRPSGADTWSAYWYNGFIYTNDIERGVDVMLLSDNARMSARKLPALNPQTQEQIVF